MKKYIAILCVFVSLLFSGCTEYHRIYVKSIALNRTNNMYELILSCYDFSSEEESFENVIYKAENIFELASKTAEEGEYSFRLCEYCLIPSELFYEIDKSVYMLNSLKFPPASDIICISDLEPELNINEINEFPPAPLYNLKSSDGKTTGVFTSVDKKGNCNGALFVHNGTPVTFLDKKHADIFRILSENADSIKYSFWENQLTAQMDIIDCYYQYDGSVLTVNLICYVDNIAGINNYA